ncbi:2-amino-4-hydroxy-6-hydroxymethyldihydropteridine diphosphokinase [Acetohalobium arabaticum]|uniref:2-amino-4-hydroxy-6-hydroxymethyldihydropteridine diphosphokinase n=1 Tax=Acetohalobium arabaticum (strain ATCC 49924 / DSM 5501 / Z-7288) TaxID=574087 RepID=D9QRZ5_ACEAZ|nr:2-amino-4-hydroxy-6-hydroxymethyldihydropteridine diphosphokinase [Acetohalobium arabaticum]ADL13286.1 2-amino-4-hydroxy-6-hydroxymethyldihydropteridin epyrophosphokinase [Acetohalobium arabaticum DSM 5501]
MTTVYLSLGSNKESREEYLQRAIKKLQDHSGIRVIASSPVYETKPVGYTDQDDFLNLVLEVKTTLASLELLDYIQEVELELDRTREIRWGPRTIDIDIILFGEKEIESERLTIPHPRFHKRAFVLVPLLDLTDEVVYEGKTAAELLDELPHKADVVEYKSCLRI